MKRRMMMGLLLAGSLFVGMAVQAQDLTEQYLDALEQAHEAAATARTAKERQQAEENAQEVEAALQALAPQAVAPQLFIPGVGTISVVSVECNGECSDNTLGQLCSLAGPGFLPLAVDCRDVDDDPPGVQCGGGGDNRCLAREVLASDALSSYCDDTSGWDANVYCVRP